MRVLVALRVDEYNAFKKWCAKKEQLFKGEKVGAQVPEEWKASGASSARPAQPAQPTRNPARTRGASEPRSRPPVIQHQKGKPRDNKGKRGVSSQGRYPSDRRLSYPQEYFYPQNARPAPPPDYWQHYYNPYEEYYQRNRARERDESRSYTMEVESRSASSPRLSSQSEFIRAINRPVVPYSRDRFSHDHPMYDSRPRSRHRGPHRQHPPARRRGEYREKTPPPKGHGESRNYPKRDRSRRRQSQSNRSWVLSEVERDRAQVRKRSPKIASRDKQEHRGKKRGRQPPRSASHPPRKKVRETDLDHQHRNRTGPPPLKQDCPSGGKVPIGSAPRTNLPALRNSDQEDNPQEMVQPHIQQHAEPSGENPPLGEEVTKQVLEASDPASRVPTREQEGGSPATQEPIKQPNEGILEAPPVITIGDDPPTTTMTTLTSKAISVAQQPHHVSPPGSNKRGDTQVAPIQLECFNVPYERLRWSETEESSNATKTSPGKPPAGQFGCKDTEDQARDRITTSNEDELLPPCPKETACLIPMVAASEPWVPPPPPALPHELPLLRPAIPEWGEDTNCKTAFPPPPKPIFPSPSDFQDNHPASMGWGLTKPQENPADEATDENRGAAIPKGNPLNPSGIGPNQMKIPTVPMDESSQWDGAEKEKCIPTPEATPKSGVTGGLIKVSERMQPATSHPPMTGNNGGSGAPPQQPLPEDDSTRTQQSHQYHPAERQRTLQLMETDPQALKESLSFWLRSARDAGRASGRTCSILLFCEGGIKTAEFVTLFNSVSFTEALPQALRAPLKTPKKGKGQGEPKSKGKFRNASQKQGKRNPRQPGKFYRKSRFASKTSSPSEKVICEQQQ